jgi:dTDP-4-amino-4,6-dideoxygalactose transaminase
VIHTGATPVFADVDPVTFNLDPAAAAAAVTSRTRALLPVHFAGRPVDVASLVGIARRRSLSVIEDAAHCVEGIAGGAKIGTTADFTCFSFYATKNITTGEGGMVTTADERAAAYIRSASLHGMSRAAWARYAPGGAPQYDVLMAGFKYNMMDLQAAIGLHQLARIGEFHARRAEICRQYHEAFAHLPLQRPAPVPDGDLHAHHLYTILVDEAAAGISRDVLQQRLGERGISTSIHFRALHLHQYYAERFNLQRGMFPNAEQISDTTLSLPLSAGMPAEAVERVIEAVHDAIR